MLKRSFLGLVSAAAVAGVAVPAVAGSGLGFDPYYVENPNGREVPQTHQSAAKSLGFDPWYVPGQYERTVLAQKKPVDPVDLREQYAHAPQVEAGHAYSEPWLGRQADA